MSKKINKSTVEKKVKGKKNKKVLAKPKAEKKLKDQKNLKVKKNRVTGVDQGNVECFISLEGQPVELDAAKHRTQVDDGQPFVSIGGQRVVWDTDELRAPGFHHLSGSQDGRYVIVRSVSAGVFAGNLIYKHGAEVVLTHARRLFYYKGAASLSQVAMSGVTDSKQCLFPCEVDEVRLFDWCEIINTTKEAEENIKAVHVWESKALDTPEVKNKKEEGNV